MRTLLPLSSKQSQKGIMLLEMILALTIFALVMVALAKSLQSAVEAATLQQKEQIIQAEMNSLLQWVRLDPKDPERLKTIERSDGISLKPSIDPIEVKNKEGEEISKLFTIKIEATIPERTTNLVRSVQMTVYVP